MTKHRTIKVVSPKGFGLKKGLRKLFLASLWLNIINIVGLSYVWAEDTPNTGVANEGTTIKPTHPTMESSASISKIHELANIDDTKKQSPQIGKTTIANTSSSSAPTKAFSTTPSPAIPSASIRSEASGSTVLPVQTTKALAYPEQDTAYYHQVSSSITQFLNAYIAQLNNENVNTSQIQHAPQYEYVLGKVDRYLNLASCKQMPLTSFQSKPRQNFGKVTLKVRCAPAANYEDGTGTMNHWSLYITAEVQAFSDILITNQSIGRGQVISKSMIRFHRQQLNQITSGFIQQPEQVVGYVSKRFLSAGQIITQGVLAAPLLVTKGQEIVLSAKAGSVKVKTIGVAQSDGVLGQYISVLNKSTRQTVKAKIISAGQVSIDL